HPVFSGPVIKRLTKAPLTRIMTTASIPIPAQKLAKLREHCEVDVLDIAALLGEVIRRAHEGRSVGEMFDE
ncbi:MAG: ribose-phosphate diphosphokinase, partial [Chloroflexota bacterium]